MAVFSDFYFPSSTGNNTIYACMTSPEGAPRAIVHIVHGIAEHMTRYRDFMDFLANNGYIVVGCDHLGHGKSIGKDGIPGFFAEKDGWNYVLKDIDHLRDLIREKYPDLPYIFFGHSMGSFLTRNYLIKHPSKYDAAIISGTGHQPLPLALSGYLLASAAVKKEGPQKIGTRLNDIAFGSYTKNIANMRTKFDWLSRDESVVDAYMADPLCGFTATVSLFRDMMSGILFITNQKNIDLMSKEQPIYFMSGKEDPVGEYGKGVNRAYDAFCKAGIKDVFMRLYPGGRHEMLNETNKVAVYQDILKWLDEKIK